MNDVCKLRQQEARETDAAVFLRISIAQSVKKFHAVRYRAYNSLPLLPTLNHINPLNTLPSCFSSILVLPSNTRLGISSGSFSSGVSTKFL